MAVDCYDIIDHHKISKEKHLFALNCSGRKSLANELLARSRVVYFKYIKIYVKNFKFINGCMANKDTHKSAKIFLTSNI